MRFRPCVAAVVLALTASLALWAAPDSSQAPPAPRRWALVIGVATYVDPAIQPLPFCIEDTRLLSEALQDAGYEVLRLADDAPEARHIPTRNNLLANTQRLLADSRIAEDDLVLIYFSGHGFATADGAYLAAQDTYESLAAITGVKVSWLRDLLKACRANKKLLILDACHSGLGKGGEKDLAAERINEAAQGAGFVTLASCRGNEKSWPLRGVSGLPDNERSAFTHFLVQALRGACDRDRDGEIGLSELNRYVYEQVTAWARAVGLEQTPVMNPASIEGELILARGGLVRAEEVLLPAQVTVESQPEGATVYLDGEVQGITPCVLRVERVGLQPSTREVRLEKEGFRSRAWRVQLVSGDKVMLTRLALTPLPAAQPARARRPNPVAAIPLAPGEIADDAEMVRVPAGWFTMGDEVFGPAHRVHLPAYRIDKHEVTVAQYARFLNATGLVEDEHGNPLVLLDDGWQFEQVNGRWRPKEGMEKLPVVNVSWYGAMAYAAWAGKRLPTEAEWEKAARGEDGRVFPWGNTWDASRCNAFFKDDPFAETAPVTSFPTGASPYGCLDLAGNVWEWTLSLFGTYPYDPSDGREDATAPGPRVMRGGCWNNESPILVRAANRGKTNPATCFKGLGFRCAQSVDEEEEPGASDAPEEKRAETPTAEN